jgi:hypothetical protein
MNGHRRFVPVFGADQGAADEILESMRVELTENDLLFEDFPEVCIAFRALEGKHQRCKSQTFESELTHIACIGEEIVLPTIRLSHEQSLEYQIPIDDRGYTRCSGGIISSHGLLSAARGMKHKRPDGTQQRPDAAIIDDPQTDRSAESPAEIAKRLRVIRKAIIPMAGQRRKLALVVNGTKITENDVMCQLQDSTLSPAWQGRSIPMLKAPATNEKLWMEDYAKLLTTWDRESPSTQDEARRRANKFYLDNRTDMDLGAEATWSTCFSPDQFEISAIQHAYNVRIEQGDDVFDSECQQNPKRIGAKTNDLKLTEIINLANGMERQVVPLWANRVVVFTDVQDDVLYWLALATGPGFRAHVCDYGVFPEQATDSMAQRDAKRKLRDVFDGSMEAALQSGITAHINRIREKIWTREADGVQMTSSLNAADSSDNTTTVYAALRPLGATPTKGRYVGAKNAPWADFPDRPGEELNREYHYSLGATKGSKDLRVFQYDTNWWKTFVSRRLRTAMNDSGSMSIFGKPAEHVHFANHCLSEYPVEVKANERTIDEWVARVGMDNHLWDCLVGAYAISAKAGATLEGLTIVRKQERKTFVIPGDRRGR